MPKEAKVELAPYLYVKIHGETRFLACFSVYLASCIFLFTSGGGYSFSFIVSACSFFKGLEVSILYCIRFL